MTWRIAVQSVLVIGALVGVLLAAGVIDVGTDPGSGSSPGAGDGPADTIDLIDESEIVVDLGDGWTLVDQWYVESTNDVDWWCAAAPQELWGELTEWSSPDGDVAVLLIGSDWRAPELHADIRAAGCTGFQVLQRENIVSVVWFAPGSSVVVDRVVQSVSDAMNAAEPYLTGQPRPTQRPGQSFAGVEAHFVPDELCTNAGIVSALDDTWATDHLDPLPLSWQNPDGVSGTLTVDGLDGVFTGPDGLSIRVTQDVHELHCTIG